MYCFDALPATKFSFFMLFSVCSKHTEFNSQFIIKLKMGEKRGFTVRGDACLEILHIEYVRKNEEKTDETENVCKTSETTVAK